MRRFSCLLAGVAARGADTAISCRHGTAVCLTR
jgi:hypothetical protein